MEFKGDDTIMVGGLCETMDAPLPGSTREPCVNCGRKVWISPASMRIVKRHKAYIACWPCAKKDGYELAMHPDQLAEWFLHRQRN